MTSEGLEKSKKTKISRSKNVKDFSQEPFVQKKADKALLTIEKYGLPKMRKVNN